MIDAIVGEQIKRNAACGAFVLLMMGVTIQSAQAQMTDPVADALLLKSQLQQGWASAVHALADLLKFKSDIILWDTANANNKNNLESAHAMQTAARRAVPTTYSACSVSQATAANAALETMGGAVAQALSNGGGRRPNDPATVAADINADIQDGLAPCTAGQSETSAHQALGCTQKWGGRWERASYLMSALINSFNLPVPPNFIPNKNGVYQQIPIVTSEKYMPFVAAFRLCQRLSPPAPPAPQAIAGRPTASTLDVGFYGDTQSIASLAYDTCMQLLEERMQYGSNTPAAYKDAHTLQALACTADAKNGFTDGDPQYTFADGSTGTCQSDGRSRLQRIFDKTHARSANNYSAIHTSGDDWSDVRRDDSERDTAEDFSFPKLIRDERAELISAIQASRIAPNWNNSSNLATLPVSP